MSEIKTPVRYKLDNPGCWVFMDTGGCYLFVLKTLDESKVCEVRDALNGFAALQARHDEAVRLLGIMGECIPRCECYEEYKCRQMIAPDCPRCQHFVESEIAEVNAYLTAEKKEVTP